MHQAETSGPFSGKGPPNFNDFQVKPSGALGGSSGALGRPSGALGGPSGALGGPSGSKKCNGKSVKWLEIDSESSK